MTFDASSPFLPVSPYIISRFLSYIILFMPSCQLLLSLEGFLLPGGFQFKTYFGIRVSSSLCTCPYHMNCLFFISSTTVCVTYTVSMIRSFVTLSSLALPAALRQKSIFVASNIRFVVFLIDHISRLYVIILFFVY